jgi:hypothetical protein
MPKSVPVVQNNSLQIRSLNLRQPNEKGITLFPLRYL